jgi:hypothetical protein
MGSDRDNRQRTLSRWIFIGFLLIAGYFLITEHRAHLVALTPYLPFLLVAACPLLHLFHHGGHGHSDEEGPRGSDGTSGPVHRH